MASSHNKRGNRLPRLQHAALPITNGKQDEIRAFYGGLLGLTEKPVPATLEGRGLVWFEGGDDEIELHFTPDPYLAHPEEGRHICLEVDDVQRYRSKLEQAGYRIIDAIPIPQRPRIFTLDPCGNHLELTTILDDYRKEE